MQIVSLLLVAVLMLSLVACKKTENGKDKNKDKVTSSQNDLVDNGDDLSDVEDEENDFTDELPIGLDDIEGLYVPESYYITQSKLEEFDLGLDDFDELDGEYEDELARNDSPIQKMGKAVSGKNRVFNINTKKTVFKNWQGWGTNTMPSGLMPTALAAEPGYDMVSVQIDRKRFVAMNGKMNRMWFQVDWIVTEEEDPNNLPENYEDNKDYQNYMNGIYDFDNSTMTALYPILDIYKEAGTDVALNYGWKNAERIQEWFAFPGVGSPRSSAPYDLDAYAKSCVATMYELYVKRGYKNINRLTFFNEPGGDNDFATYFDPKPYFVRMLQKVEEALVDVGIRDEIEIWAAEQNSISPGHHAFTDYMKMHGTEYFDRYAAHYYYSTSKQADNYDYAYSLFSWLASNYHEHPFFLTEMYAGAYGYRDGPSGNIGRRMTWWHWGDSNVSYLIVAANTGINGVLSWGFTGGQLPNPTLFDPASGIQACWYTPNKEGVLDGVNHTFFETSLFTNYLPVGSDILMIDWTGDDVRGTAFKLPDGGYTIFVEANGFNESSVGTEYEVKNAIERDITINLNGNKKSLKFYKYRCIYDELTDNLNPHATMLQPVKTIETKNRISDTISKDCGFYMYTTMKPIAQIEITDDNPKKTILHKISAGDSIQFGMDYYNCSGEIGWRISASNLKTGTDAGTITQNGLYTASSAANKGDRIAVEVYLKSNPSVFDTVVISIK